MPAQGPADSDPLDWREWPEPKKRLLRARLLERTMRPWREVARPEQLPPDGDWYIWFLIGGRGAGKTRAGAEWLAEELRQDGPGDESTILAPTFGDARDTCVEGPSGLLRALGTSRAEVEAGRSYTVERWNRSMGELRLRSGAVVHIDGADDGALRTQGGNLRRAWCDELRLWKQPLQAWDESLLPAVRLGKPRIVVTSTPKPTVLVKRLVADPGVVKSHMTMFDNEANLADAFLSQMRDRYGGTRLGRQELEGLLLEDVEGALFKRAWIDDARLQTSVAPLRAAILGLDPADGLGDGDEQGACLAGIDMDGALYVRGSWGHRETPIAWLTWAVRTAVEHKATIVVEKNHGGGFLTGLLDQVMADTGVRAPYKVVSASVGKLVRAEPVAGLYEQGKVCHLGTFVELEEEMCQYDGTGASPGRLDAAVWALSEAMGYGSIGTDSGEGAVPYDGSPRERAREGAVAWR